MTRARRLLAAMTLEEKLGQLTMAAGAQALTGPVAGFAVEAEIAAGRVGSLLNLWGAQEVEAVQAAARESRLGIPLLIGFDALHGHRTIFPIPLAEACAFDSALWERTAAAAAREARADGIDMVFAPMADVARDPRWGRIAEGAGEDPYVAGAFAAAKVRGFQGAALETGVAACVKHFCAYGAVEGGRDYASADVSARAVLEVHAPPFAAALDAGCAALMPAFMDLSGVPMTAHEELLQGWLRLGRGFTGVIVSDYNAVAELIVHGVAAGRAEAAAIALNAGVDLDMMSFCYRDGLPEALERGLVSMERIDAAVSRVLELKEKLGLFERAPSVHPIVAVGEDASALAREAARRSIVLLTDRGAVLPFEKGLRRIALIGPLADAPLEMDGPWAGAGDRAAAVSIRAGLSRSLPEAEIVYAPGVAIEGLDESGVPAALEACEGADVVILCLGESAPMSGEAASRTRLGLPGRQRALAQAALRLARRRGVASVVLLSSGRPLVAPWLFEEADVVLATWFLGEAAGEAVADVLTGACDAVGRLPVSWPRAEGQIPVYFAQRPSGRPYAAHDSYTSRYLDSANEPQFPFGHGLSYAALALTSFDLDKAAFRRDDELRFSVGLRNEGERDGEATVFLFARDPVASVVRPMLELKRFGRIFLRAGEAGALELRLPACELAFPGRDLKPVFEPGVFEFFAGFSAERAGLLKLTAQAPG